VNETTKLIEYMIFLAGSGQAPMNGLRIDRDSELIAYAAIKITIIIFHLGGGGRSQLLII
jgi:hypothetical protein